MPRLTADQWETVRAEFEAGATLRELEGRHHVDKAAISRKATRGEWRVSDDVGAAIRAKVNAKVNGVVNADPVKKAEAINAAADRAAEVQRRHQEEPGVVRGMLYTAVRAHKAAEDKQAKALAFDDLKAAKISSEVLMNIHSLERKAWSLDDPGPKDITKLSDAELEAMVRGK